MSDALALAASYAAAAYAALPSNDARISDETRAMANHLDCRLAAAADAAALPVRKVTGDLVAAAADLLGYMEDALTVHVYSLEDHDRIPANCGMFTSIVRMRAALGLPASDIEVTPVWAFSATFANEHGEADDYQAEVLASTAMAALDRGYADLLLMNPGASKIDSRADLVAGTVEG